MATLTKEKKQGKRSKKKAFEVSLDTLSPAQVLEQNGPYVTEPLWVEHQIKYFEFAGHEFVEDLSFVDYPCTILLFKVSGDFTALFF